MREILTAGRYFRKKFGESVYKIPISISGFTCPNIDGTVARGGCVFCENESFSPNLENKQTKRFALSPTSENPYLAFQLRQLEAQYKKTKVQLHKKFGVKKFIIYFQSFTNTYAPLETLKALYEKALSFEGVIGLSIGTRTDSISEEVIAYLAHLSKDKEIWVEYGIQSSNDETLRRINRGHDSSNIAETIALTHRYGLNICAHVIFGLPNETEDMVIESVKFALKQGVHSFKFHPLYVGKRTALAKDFKKGLFTPISEESYIKTMIEAIKITPEDIVFQRLSAGIEDDSLLAPSWCYNKHQQMQNIRNALKKEGMLY